MDLISAYADGISRLPRYAPPAPQSPPLRVDVIVNPTSGFFKHKAPLRRIVADLDRRLDALEKRFPGRKAESETVHFTEYAGHAHRIVEGLLEKEARAPAGGERFLISCGGDGNHYEICTSLVEAAPAVLDRIKLLRLPMGTGNDVTEAATIEEACGMILGGAGSVKTGALRVEAPGLPVLYSFNIASIGIDAFVVEITNRLKKVMPGAYKALVDVGSLFYERTIRPKPMNIALRHAVGTTELRGILPSIVVMGISGHRTYGGHVPVLCDDRNVCIVEHLGLLGLLRSKKLIFEARHGELPETRFYTADRMELESEGNLVMQLDGEVFRLSPANYPLTMSLLEPRIRVLSKG